MQLFTGYTANSQNNQHPFIFVVWDIQFHIHTATKSPPQSLLSRIIYSELSQELSVPKHSQELSISNIYSQELSVFSILKSYLSETSRVICPKHSQELFIQNIKSYLSQTFSRVIIPFNFRSRVLYPPLFSLLDGVLVIEVALYIGCGYESFTAVVFTHPGPPVTLILF